MEPTEASAGAGGAAGRVAVAERSCPDCGGVLSPIVMLSPEQSFAYGHPGGGRDWWFGGLEIAGHVRAALCCSCLRVFWYAVPRSAPSEVTPSNSPTGRGDEPTPTPNGAE